MKLICRQSDLNNQLSLVSRAVSTRPTQPILGNVLLTAGDDLRLTGFDLSLGIESRIVADVQTKGAITLPAKLFTDIISRIPSDQEITIEVGEDNQTAIASETGVYNIRGLDAEDFPTLPTVEGTALTFPIADLIEGITRTISVASNDETKQVLTGIHISQNGDRLEYAATDGHRLSVLKQTAEIENDFAVTIPSRALRELEKLTAGQEGDVSLLVDDVQAVFQIGDLSENRCAARRLVCRKLDGAYPSYNQLIPVKFSRDVTVDRRRLIGALERVGVLADQKNNLVKLSTNFEAGRLTVAVEAQDLGNGKESFNAAIGGMPGDFEIAFNIKYLLDGLKTLPSQEIKINLNESNQPVILTPLGESMMTYLLMPVQIAR